MKDRVGEVPTLISAIVPTIGRPESLKRLLGSLSSQTRPVDEVLVADASDTDETELIANDPSWRQGDLRVVHVRCDRQNAVQQREQAVRLSTGEYLLFLDDDVVLETDCVEQLLGGCKSYPNVVAVTADFNNQNWPQPTRIWRLYLKRVLRIPAGEWQGRVVGPLLRFGYNPTPDRPTRVEWFGTGNSLIRRSAFDRAGGFSKFFLHRSTINEDVDLSLKLNRIGDILFCPTARMSHDHAAEGRLSGRVAAEDDLFNRYYILTRTLRYTSLRAFVSVAVYFFIETASQLLGSLRRLRFEGFCERLIGRLSALCRIIGPPGLKSPRH